MFALHGSEIIAYLMPWLQFTKKQSFPAKKGKLVLAL
jgi:hypothetical protein